MLGSFSWHHELFPNETILNAIFQNVKIPNRTINRIIIPKISGLFS
jgi:hypothetical protein